MTEIVFLEWWDRPLVNDGEESPTERIAIVLVNGKLGEMTKAQWEDYSLEHNL